MRRRARSEQAQGIGIHQRCGAVKGLAERCLTGGGWPWAALNAGRGQHAAPAARSARTNGVEAVSWSTQNLMPAPAAMKL